VAATHKHALGDDEVLAEVIAAADHDMALRMSGVEMVDRDPVEPGAEVLFRLPHEVAGEGADIREPVAVLGGDDEAELVTAFAAALLYLAEAQYWIKLSTLPSFSDCQAGWRMRLRPTSSLGRCQKMSPSHPSR